MGTKMKKIFMLSLIISVIFITFSQNVLIINATQNGESEVNSSEFFTSDTISVGDNTQEADVLSEVKEIETISVTEALDDGYDTVEGIDVEETGLWEGFLLGAGTTPAAKTLPSLTGNQRTDVANIAKSQVGYAEGSGNLNIYGQELGYNGLEWCAYFVRWCLNKAGVSDGPTSGSTTTNVKWFQDRGRWHNVQAVSWSYTNSGGVTIKCDGTVDSAYVPQVGDYVAVENNGKAGDGPGHTAMVVAVDNSWVYTVEGNSGDAVVQRKYSRSGYRLNGVSGSSTYISGFGSINYTVSNNLPVGQLDGLTGGNGTIYVRGWAYDKDNLSSSVKIEVYIGSAEGWWFLADTKRTDVNDVYPGVGNYHGYEQTINVKSRGTYSVRVYAVDLQDESQKTLLGEKTITISAVPFSITYNPTSASMKVGETKTISVDFKGDGIHTLRAVSGNTNVVSHVSWGETDWTNGKSTVTIKALSAGTANYTIQMLDDDENILYSKSMSVTVKQPVTNISLSASSYTLNVGSVRTITTTISPSDASDKRVTWSSSNSNVVTVSSSGVITAKAVGTATITATAQDGSGKKATCTVTVKQTVTGVSLNTSSCTLNVGGTKTLTATVAPSNASNKGVNWSSSNTSVATVSSSGVVTAKAAGTATITATAQDGSGKKATCTVTVKQPVTGVSLNTSSCTLNVGGTKTLTATVAPSNASNKGVNWSSSNTSVATVSSSGVVTAKAAGTATITATAQDGSGKKATCTVTVKQPVTGVSLSTTSCTINVGGTKTLTATVSPSNTSNKGVNWSSSNTSVATVSSSGVVTAKAIGTATITATAADGSGKKATCTITVTEEIVQKWPIPTNKKIVNVVSGVHVYWNELEGATSYKLYRALNGSEGYVLYKTGITATHYLDTDVTSGVSYSYRVVAVNDERESYWSEKQDIIYVGTPDITSRINKGAGIQIGWNNINGATGYAIYRKPYEGGTWERITTISGNSTFTYTDTTVKGNNGTIYRYTVRALAGSDMKTLSGCRSTGRTMVRLSSRVMNSVVKASDTAIKCNWTTSSAVTGYEVRFMIGSTVYKTYTIGNYKTGVKTFTGLPAGNTYKVQVRAYKKVEGVGSFYSAWSTEKYVEL